MQSAKFPRRASRALVAAALAAVIEPLEQRLCLTRVVIGGGDGAPTASASSSTAAAARTTSGAIVNSVASGSISGTAFGDLNGNGTFDSPTESGIAGVTVFLDLNNSGTFDAGDASTTTVSGGAYNFTSLDDGTYAIGETTPAGYIRTGSTFQSATVTAGGAVTGKNFGNFKTTYTGSVSVDSWTIRIDPADSTREQISETLAAQTAVTWSISKSLVPALTVNAGLSDDLVIVDYTNGNPMPSGGINVDGGAHSSTIGDRVSLVGSAGADAVVVSNLDSVSGNAALAIKNIQHVIASGGGNNDSLAVVNALTGCDVAYDGGAGSDTLTFSGSDAVDNLTLNTGSISDGTLTSTYSNLESLVVNTFGGADAVLLQHTNTAPATTLNLGDNDDQMMINTANTVGVTISGGNGNDLVVVGQAGAAPVSFDGGAGANDRMTVDGTNGDDTLTIDATQVFRTGSAGASVFSNVEALTVDGAAGNDGITLTGTLATMPVTILGSAGNDTLTLSGAPAAAVAFNGGTDPGDHDTLNVNAGTYTFAADAAAGTSNLTLNVGAAGAATFNATQHLAALSVAGVATLSSGGSKVLVTKALDVPAGGKLDLSDNDLIVNYTGPGSPLGSWDGSNYSGILGLLAAGYNQGDWNGSGIRTSSFAGTTTLGCAEASEALSLSGTQTTLWSGQTVDATAVLVKFTYQGDANLDGVLNIDDYTRIDSSVAVGGALKGWFNGDFNCDGNVDIDDYTIIDSALGVQGAPL